MRARAKSAPRHGEEPTWRSRPPVAGHVIERSVMMRDQRRSLTIGPAASIPTRLVPLPDTHAAHVSVRARGL